MAIEPKLKQVLSYFYHLYIFSDIHDTKMRIRIIFSLYYNILLIITKFSKLYIQIELFSGTQTFSLMQIQIERSKN